VFFSFVDAEKRVPVGLGVYKEIGGIKSIENYLLRQIKKAASSLK